MHDLMEAQIVHWFFLKFANCLFGKELCKFDENLVKSLCKIGKITINMIQKKQCFEKRITLIKT